MTTIDSLLKVALNTAVDYSFIKSVVGDSYKLGMLDYENITERTTLAHIFKKKDCVAILFHIINRRTLDPFDQTKCCKQENVSIFR